MTKKRFRKLCRSEMSKLMKNQEGAGRCIKVASQASATTFSNYNSYQEAWNALRFCFIRLNNIPPMK